MILDKALLVKGAVGAASVAGLGGIVVFRKELGIVKSSKAATQQNTSGPQVAGRTSGQGGAAGARESANPLTPTPQEEQVDALGIPTRCASSSPCTLKVEELKKIKFEVLEEITNEEVTVDPSSPASSISLTIKTSPEKKYVFNNSGSSAITLKKGNDQSKTVVLEAGNTEFTEENNALKKVVAVVQPQSPVAVSQSAPSTLEIDDKGIPTKCNTTNPCALTVEELKKIKFKVLEEIANGEVTVEPNPSQNITLTIGTSNPKIYTFNNSGSKLTLKRGSGTNNSVILDAGDTEFKEEGNKLVAYEESSFTTVNTTLGTLNLPNKCKFKSSDKNNASKECEVTVDELKKVKFENKQDNQDLTITGTSETIKLEIKILKNGTDAEQYGSDIRDNDPRITFKDTTSKITISGDSSVGNIVIPKGSNMEFLINSVNRSTNKISKYKKGLGDNPPSWGISCSCDNKTKKYECTPYSPDKAIKFLNDSSSFEELNIGEENKEKKIFTAEEEVEGYNQGFKFEINEVITSSSGTPSLTKGDSYEIKYMSGK